MNATGSNEVRAGKTGPLLQVIIAVLVTLAIILTIWLGGWFRHSSAPLNLAFWSVSYSPDGKYVVTGGGEIGPTNPGELVFWEIGSDDETAVAVKGSIRSVAWSPDGKYIAAGDFSGLARLFKPRSGDLMMALSPPAQQMNAVASSKLGNLVAGATFDGTIDLWDETGKEQRILTVPGEAFLDVAFSPSGEFLAATAKSGMGYIFSLGKDGSVLKLEAYAGPPRPNPSAECVAISPDSETVATGSLRTLRIWNAATGDKERQMISSANVNNIAFSPVDDNLIAAVQNDGMLVLWNYHTGEKINSTQAHPGESFGLSFSPDGKKIATTSIKDKTIKIWDAGTLQPLQTHHRFGASTR